MNQSSFRLNRTRAGLGRNRSASILAILTPPVVIWVVAWTIIFSAIDFWSIRLYQVEQYHWFQEYRAAMRYGASWLSPPSFALAENAYFVWMNMYDRHYKMHEWAWYTGDPVNPDGYFNFVWGDGRGRWVKFPMKVWYGLWSIPSALWFGGVKLASVKLRRNRAMRFSRVIADE